MQSKFKLLLLAALSFALTGFASSGGKVTDISARELASGPAIHIGGEEIPKPVGKWEDGAFLLHLQGKLCTPGLTVRRPKGGIKAFSFCQEGEDVSIAIRPAIAKEPDIEKVEDGWLVSFDAKAPELAEANLNLSANLRTASPDDVMCSLQVSEMDPGKILQTLSAQTHANLVLLSKPDTKITIRLSHVPLSEMIRHICAMCDLAFIRLDKAYIIATPDKLKASYPKEWEALHPAVPVEPPSVVQMATETYDTSFVTGEEIVKALDKIYKDKNLLIVAGPPPMSPEIGSQDSAKATGTATAILTKTTTSDLAARLVIITGEKQLVDSALAMAKRLDKPRKQVAIAVTIHDISDDALNDVGINWNFNDVSVAESNPNGFNFGSFTRTPLGLSGALKALVQTGKSKLLASPNVSVLDGERAFVLIGDRISYPVLIGYSQNNAPIFSKEEERVGIYLQVTASIGHDGSVTLSLYPQVSTITGFLTVNGASYPQISTREAQTTLRVASGQTIVMGGLFSDEDIAQVEKVPFLSQIPIIGAIFQHRKVTKTKSQVIITVTPTVIAEGAK